ncbi:MAG: mannose-1-phosphate guanylyltransferase [Anaerolineae bacterium]|nr:mannose-1-phosphate guanylyltransferase [Anaerolineae bacterium]MDW8101833.1 mannose-1-phosphate guanylyltransferase [Anaerolineae bacterium]
MFALILAGGTGTRLWPKSRKHRPKQLLDIVAKNTMLQETFMRIRPILDPTRIFVVTNKTYAPTIKAQLPLIPGKNIIIEPEGKGTAPCIGLSVLYIRRENPEEVMASLHADHVIEKAEEFRKALLAAAKVAQEGYLVTLGIKPTCPETGYGYICQGQFWKEVDGFPVYKVKSFTEKPDFETACSFLAQGGFYWNSGIFVWKLSTIMEEFREHMPRFYSQLLRIDEAIGTEEEEKVLEEVWQEVESESIDQGIMEKSSRVMVIPVDIGWSDVGNWSTLADILPKDEENNVIVGGEHIGIDTTGSLLYSTKRLIATIGLKDMIVVDTDDVVLVCPKDRAQDVKKLVEMLKGKNLDEYL